MCARTLRILGLAKVNVPSASTAPAPVSPGGFHFPSGAWELQFPQILQASVRVGIIRRVIHHRVVADRGKEKHAYEAALQKRVSYSCRSIASVPFLTRLRVSLCRGTPFAKTLISAH